MMYMSTRKCQRPRLACLGKIHLYCVSPSGIDSGGFEEGLCVVLPSPAHVYLIGSAERPGVLLTVSAN